MQIWIIILCSKPKYEHYYILNIKPLRIQHSTYLMESPGFPVNSHKCQGPPFPRVPVLLWQKIERDSFIYLVRGRGQTGPCGWTIKSWTYLHSSRTIMKIRGTQSINFSFSQFRLSFPPQVWKIWINANLFNWIFKLGTKKYQTVLLSSFSKLGQIN